MTIDRDTALDRLRGFAMLWVIVVHVLYWGNFFASEQINLLKSFCLFEMPLFFFITGASNSFGKTDNYFNFVYKRFKRVLIPYWVFAIICALLSIVKLSTEMNLTYKHMGLIILSWLIPMDRQITTVPYLTWALWFIPVYLCIILILPVLKRMKQSNKQLLFGFLLLLAFLASCLLNTGWPQNITFYTLWTYIGLFYRDIKCCLTKKHNHKYFWYAALAAATTMCALYAANHSLDMQFNKFPPNTMFLAFSFIAMPLIALATPHVEKAFKHIEKHKAANKIIQLFSTNSMTIFLYQVFAFNLTIPLTNSLLPSTDTITAVVKSTVCLITTIPTCAVLAIVLGGIENLGMKKE